ncbi:MAG: hypothetical protein ACRC4M_04790 [Mycoplasma sp.]
MSEIKKCKGCGTEMILKEGISKASGKPWAKWECPSRKWDSVTKATVGCSDEDGMEWVNLKADVIIKEDSKCKECGSDLVLRTARNSGKKFWGCSSWSKTKCKGLEQYVGE